MDLVALSPVDLTNPGVQLIVGDAAPELRLFVVDRLGVGQAARGTRVRVQVHAVAVITGAVGWRRGLRPGAEWILQNTNSSLLNSLAKLWLRILE